MRIFVLFVLAFGILAPVACSQQPVFRQPTAYVRGFIANDSISWSSINYKAFRLYFKEESYAAHHLDALEQALDWAYYRVLSVLDVSRYPYGIYLLAVDSKEEMQQVMGYKIKGGAAPGHDLVFFVFNTHTRPQFKHELFHLISFETWGPPASRLLDEGGACYADNFCFYDNPMYTINAYYARSKQLFSLRNLVEKFEDQVKTSDVISYIQSAGVFKYLYEKYGMNKLKSLWTLGFGHFESIYGFSVEQFESDWLLFIQTIPVPEDFDVGKLKEGCG